MAGNEVEFVRFLINNIGKLKLSHLGKVREIGVPCNQGKYHCVSSVEELKTFTTEDASKKADIYINGYGVSIKQAGGSFGFNRMQRSELVQLLTTSGIKNTDEIVKRFDTSIKKFHSDDEMLRDRPWSEIMNETEFKQLTQYLLTIGSPNKGDSKHPADFILEAPSKVFSEENIAVHTFDEYFETHKNSFVISLRRVWIGQSSDSEHRRAVGLARKPGNKPWIFDTISGEPRVSKKTGERWRPDVKLCDRKTIYLVFIEKK